MYHYPFPSGYLHSIRRDGPMFCFRLIPYPISAVSLISFFLHCFSHAQVTGLESEQITEDFK